jgi:hypothetical protein
MYKVPIEGRVGWGGVWGAGLKYTNAKMLQNFFVFF